MATKRSVLQLVALFLAVISLVHCSNSPSCVLVTSGNPAVRVLNRTPATTAGTGTGCPTSGGGGGGGGTCSSTLTPAEVLFAQSTTGAITTLAIYTPGASLALMCTTATAGLGQIAVANVAASNEDFLYTLSIALNSGTKTGTISGFAIGHVAPVTLTSTGSTFTISGTNVLQTVVELQADPFGRFLTITDAAASLVHVLLIDPTFGTLTEAPGSPFTVPNALFTAVGATGEFLYVTDQSDAEIFVFSIDVTSSLQVLTAQSTFVEPTHAPANAPISMQVNVPGTFLYTGNTSSISIYAINPIDGSLSPSVGSPVTPSPGFNPQLVTMDITGSFLYVLGQALQGVLGFTINPDGSLTLIPGSAFASGLSVTDMLVNPLGGQMYLLIAGGINVYALDPTSGVLTPPTGTSTFTSSSNLAAANVQ
jgi:6-phosphogluconolactonase (cycloisomerase 2 family)